MYFLDEATKFVEFCQTHGNKPQRNWRNYLAATLRIERRNTHWLDPNSGCSEFHHMRSCVSGDACMYGHMHTLLVLPEKLTRKAHSEIELLWGGCFQETSQSSCRADCHRNRRHLKPRVYEGLPIMCPMCMAVACYKLLDMQKHRWN